MTQINTSDLFNATRGFDYTLIGLNTASNNLLSIFLLMAVFIALLFGLRGFLFADRFLSASIATFIVSLLFVATGFTSIGVVSVWFSIVVIAILLTWVRD